MTTVNVKHVKVTVSDGVISCNPEDVIAKSANTLLVFTLETAGYVFPDSDAVVVTGGGAEFPYPLWKEAPKVVALYDRNSNQATYNYTIAVVDQFSGQRFSVDPAITNDGKATGKAPADVEAAEVAIA
jgi:hypothetical protein